MHYPTILLTIFTYSFYARLITWWGVSAYLLLSNEKEETVQPQHQTRVCCDCEDHQLHEESLKEVDDYLNRSKL